MSSADKRLVQMRANPKGDWQIADLEVVATALGMKIRRSGGSHVVFSHSTISARLTVPARRPIKPIYIRQFVALVDEIRSSR
jgi:predicted RNA binding protein YcfA (HicA-like mRNA interferase family)